MGIKVHDLKPGPGLEQARQARRSRHRAARAARPPAAASRARRRAGNVPTGFEGGQMPLHMRVPKLTRLQQPVPRRVPGRQPRHDRGRPSSTRSPPTSLHGKGLTGKGALVKVLGRGELSRKVTVKAHAFSKAAEAAITAAGGSVEVLPLPWGDRRPPAKGNQFANR